VINDLYEKRREQMFPRLSEAQIARLRPQGQVLATEVGQVLMEPGQTHRPFLVLLSGRVEIMLPGRNGEDTVHLLAPGEFAGEMSTLRGIAGFTRLRVRIAGEVLSLDEEALRALVQTDSELSEILVRAFILRRVGLMNGGQSEVTLLGSRGSAATLMLREFLGRNAFPYVNVDMEQDAEAPALLKSFNLGRDELPVLIVRDQVHRHPSIAQAAQLLGMNPPMEPGKVHDLIVVGAGPAGLAAAVYAASEGLSVLVLEAMAYGGQAGTSSKIENYLGFPTGISGQALAGRAFVQAQKFGAGIQVARHALRLHCDEHPYGVELDDGSMVRSHCIVIATGAQYRQLELENLDRYTNVGIYHAATHLEAKLCNGEEVVIVGGGNSAGQAAVFLASACRHVHIVVRAKGLAESMSHYLIRRINESPMITLHTRTQIVGLEGEERLQRIRWRSAPDGGAVSEETKDIGHVFLMTGAVPNTKWLEGCVALDEQGFVRTGLELKPEDLPPERWNCDRPPFLLETSKPGVFAVGDVRSGSVKRVASSVGEGSVCVQFVHRALAQMKQ